MITVHMAVFVVCFGTYKLFSFLYALVAPCHYQLLVERFAKIMYPITLCLATLNCCFDPSSIITLESFQKSFYINTHIKMESLFKTETPLTTKPSPLPAIQEEVSDQTTHNGGELMLESTF